VRLLRFAYDLGITFFDTADVYGDGYGETLLRDAMAGVRPRCVYATKVGYDWYNHKRESGQREHPQDYSPGFIRFAVEQSLRRLGTGYIDWLQLHNPRLDALQSDELAAELERLRDEGMSAPGASPGVRPSAGATRACTPWAPGAPPMQIIHNLLEQSRADHRSRA
jgi:aryl-alcohol dehydrogenase-like predicted oxidoreductase